jgi:hypothetical protein
MNKSDELRVKKISVKIPEDTARELKELTHSDTLAEAILKITEDLRVSIMLYEQERDLLHDFVEASSYFDREEEWSGFKSLIKSAVRQVFRAVKSQLEAADEELYRMYGYKPELEDRLKYLSMIEERVHKQVRLIFAYLKEKAREAARREG